MCFHVNRLDHSGAVIIPPTEPANENHYLVIVKAGGSIDQGVYMHYAGTGTGKLESIGGLMITV
jgi:hypothetical protein